MQAREAPPGRILHVLNRLGDRGDGISNVCVDLACQQAMEGDVVAVATTIGGYTDLVQRYGVEVVEIDFRGRDPKKLFAAVTGLRRVLRRFRPDVVHSHTLVSTVIARCAVLGTRTKVVSTVHNEYQRGVLLMAAAHRVIGVSKVVSESMRRRHIPRRKIRTVLNGTVGSVRRASEPAPGGSIEIVGPAIVSVGAVSHRKGADLLVEAAIELAASFGAHTYFAGNIDWDAPVTRAKNSAVADHIHFLGFQADPRPLLAAGSVFALASRRDPAPLVLVEAMEAGLPIVAAAVDGVPELVGDDAALLVPADDLPALTAAIALLLGDAPARDRLAEAGRRRSADLSVKRVTSQYRQVYSELSHGDVRTTASSRPEADSR